MRVQRANGFVMGAVAMAVVAALVPLAKHVEAQTPGVTDAQTPAVTAAHAPVPAAAAGPTVATQARPTGHVFVDLPPDTLVASAARWLRGAGHANGVAPGRYGPDHPMNRADLFTLLWRIAGRPDAPPSGLADVPRSAPYAAPADWAVDTGLTTVAHTTGHFDPAARVRRADMVTLLWRQAGRPAAPAAGFTDVPRSADYAPAADWAHAAGLTRGVAGGDRFEPDRTLTRGEAAVWVWAAAGRPDPALPSIPPYWSTESAVSPATVALSWRPGCPVHWSDLTVLHVRYIGFDGRPRTGPLVVNRAVIPYVDAAFRHMYDERFPIERVGLVEEVGGSDAAAMDANLTSAFNCRAVTGGSRWSEHAYGWALDINPRQNPYVTRSGQVLPAAGRAHLDRSRFGIGVIQPDSPPVAVFEYLGFGWGGRWSNPADFQHFSLTGR